MAAGNLTRSAVIVGLGVIVAKVALSMPRASGDEAAVAITWLAVISFVVIGFALLAGDLPPANGWGCLLVAASTVPGDLNDPFYQDDRFTVLGYVLEPLYLPATVALVLRYPGARLTRVERGIVTAMVVSSSGMRVLTVASSGQSRDGFYRPDNWATLEIPPWWHDVVFQGIGRVVTAALLLLAAFLLLSRLVSAAGLPRRSLAPLAVTGAICAAAAAVDQLIWVINIDGLRAVPAALLRDLSAAAIPVALLADLLSRRAAAAAVSEQVLRAARRGDIPAIQAALRLVLHDPTLTVAVADRTRGWVDPVGDATQADSRPGRRLEIVRLDDDTPLAAIDGDARALSDEDLLRTTVSAVLVGAENIRLSADLLVRMAELRESRARIVEAGIAERRRVERDLHDGAQQKLLGVAATLARADLVDEDERLRNIVTDARVRLADAIRDLRELARGIHPAALSQGGLPAAIPSLCAAAPCPVDLRIDADLTVRRPTPAQETAVYFMVGEAMANAARHARPKRIIVDIGRQDGLLRAVVSDDGRGGARILPGGGLAGLADRVEALGGTFVVHSSHEPEPALQRGTTLEAMFAAVTR